MIVDTFNRNSENMSQKETYKNVKIITELLKLRAKSKLYTDEERRKLGVSLNSNVLQFCQFGGKPCSFERDFNWYFDFDYGNCFQFNSGKLSEGLLKQTYLEGSYYGLSLHIGPLINENLKYPTSNAKGLKVFIHNQSFAPTSSEGISVKTGEEANIIIKKTFTHNHPWPYSDCNDFKEFNSFLYDFITLTLKRHYRQKDCFYLCGQKYAIERCKCYNSRMPEIIQAPPCLNLTQMECIRREEVNIDQKKLIECQKECPLECDSVGYDLYASSLEYPSHELYNIYKEETQITDFDGYKNAFLALNIYYSSAQYTDIIESPKTTLVDMISSVGGALGIFLGFSIFSLFEILELLFQIFYILLFRKTNQVQ